MTHVCVLGTGGAGALARFTIPRRVRFVTEWPMSATKIQKRPLRERIARELEEHE